MNAINKIPRRSATELTRFDQGIIRRKVSQLIGRYGLTYQDRESLTQELTTKLLHSLASFDESKAHRNVFVTTVVERDVAKIVRHQRAEKRDYRRISSLNAMVPFGSEGYVELGATIGTDAYDARRRQDTRSPEEHAELVQDVADLLSSLPAELRELSERLKEKSLAQIARDMDVPRSTLRARLAELRARFESADMRFHL